MNFKGLFGGKSGQKRQQQSELERIQKDFIRGVSKGEYGVLDRFNNRLDVGDKIVHLPVIAPVWDIIALQPVIAPNVEPGTMQMTIACSLPINLMAGMTTLSMMLVQKGQQAPAPPAPPPDKPADPPVEAAVDKASPIVLTDK